MNFELALASGIITLALVFYTAGVFAERRAGALKPRHLVLFYLGLACDTFGTSVMTNLAAASGANPVHAVTGALALVLVLVHAGWATVTLARGSESARAQFHRLSIAVWLFWLVPYACGVLMGIPALAFGAPEALACSIALSVGIGGVLCLRANFGTRALAHR